MARSRIVKLVPNVPQQLALLSDGTASASGEQVRFDLVDGRALLLDLETAQRLSELEVRLEEPFWISLKWTGDPAEASYIDLWLDPAGEKRRAQEEAPELERQLRESIRLAELARRKEPGRAPRPVVSIRSLPADSPVPPGAAVPPAAFSDDTLLSFQQLLVSETNALSDAYAEAVQYASGKHGNAVKPEDIRTFVVTSYIQHHPRGGYRRSERRTA